MHGDLLRVELHEVAVAVIVPPLHPTILLGFGDDLAHELPVSGQLGIERMALFFTTYLSHILDDERTRLDGGIRNHTITLSQEQACESLWCNTCGCGVCARAKAEQPTFFVVFTTAMGATFPFVSRWFLHLAETDTVRPLRQSTCNGCKPSVLRRT